MPDIRRPALRFGTTAVAVALALSCKTAVPAPEPVIVPVPVAAPSPSGVRAPTTPPPSSNVPSRRAERVAGRDVGDTTIRVLLSSNAQVLRIASPGALLWSNRDGSSIARASAGEVWRVERSGRRVRALGPGGGGTPWSEGPLFARPLDAALLSVGGKPYRGDIALYGGDSGVVAVNVVKIDDYLRGVVPLEIGTRAAGDSAAAQAQAVTARSYAYIHLSSDPFRVYDVTSGVLDQVYGGVGAETGMTSEAVETTRALVLLYAGRVVNAPYHSTCGGSTAAASEIWRTNDEPYLQAVSDRIPGSDRFYCDISPSFRWTRTLEASTVNMAVARYLKAYTSVPPQGPGIVRDVTIGSHTPSGRVGTVTITTERGNFVVRGNDIRFVLRQSNGEILNSTDFSVDSRDNGDCALVRLIVRGSGNGHGVGMCQWGAIGRARAGQDFRTILRTYFPGASVGSPR
ncbi:MAG: SpoIID/LytB domain-containing protein [Gemmatimonadaceae bacterium]